MKNPAQRRSHIVHGVELNLPELRHATDIWPMKNANPDRRTIIDFRMLTTNTWEMIVFISCLIPIFIFLPYTQHSVVSGISDEKDLSVMHLDSVWGLL